MIIGLLEREKEVLKGSKVTESSHSETFTIWFLIIFDGNYVNMNQGGILEAAGSPSWREVYIPVEFASSSFPF